MIKVIEKLISLDIMDICSIIDINSLDKICKLITELDSIHDICSVSCVIHEVITAIGDPFYKLISTSLLKLKNIDELRTYFDDDILDVLEETLEKIDDENKASAIVAILYYFRESDDDGD